MTKNTTKKSSELELTDEQLAKKEAEEKALKEAEAVKAEYEAKLKALTEAEEKAAREAEELKKQAEAEAQANLLKVKNWTCTTQCFFNGRLYREGDVLSDACAGDLGEALAYFKGKA